MDDGLREGRAADLVIVAFAASDPGDPTVGARDLEQFETLWKGTLPGRSLAPFDEVLHLLELAELRHGKGG